MKRVLLISGRLVILLFVTGMLYLIHSEAGLRWMITKVLHSVDGLSIKSTEGRLAGPMKIRGIIYKSGNSSFGIDEITLDWKAYRLIFLEAHFSNLKIEGVTIITAGKTEPAEPAAGFPELSIPLKIVLEKAMIKNISIIQSGDQNPVNVQTISLQGRMSPKAIRIDQLDIEMPELTLAAKGCLSPTGNYPMNISTSWKIRAPGYEEISGHGKISGTFKMLKVKQETTYPFSSDINLNISDIIKNPSWEGSLAVREFNTLSLTKRWPELTFSGNVSGHGSGTNANISSLTLRIFGGIVTGNGFMSWEPDINWTFNINSESLNPGIQWPEWQGSMDLTLHSSGQYKKGALTVQPTEVTVKGDLSGRKLKAHAQFSAKESQLELAGLEVSSGKSHLFASGKVFSDKLSIKWKVQIDAEDLIPTLKGVIGGRGSVTGSRSYPLIKGTINGRAISYDNYSAESIKTVFNIDTKDERESFIDISAANILVERQKIKSVSLKSNGLISAHSISMDALMNNQSMAISIAGGYSDEVWNGRFNSLLINAGKFGKWSLGEPASLSISMNKAYSDFLCMVSNETGICFQASWDRTEGVKGKFTLTDLPFSTIKTIFTSPVDAEGNISGDGEISKTPAGIISGNASLVISSGRLHYQADDVPVDITLGKSRIDIIMDEKTWSANAEIIFPDMGHIKGKLNFPMFMPDTIDTPANQQIIGHITAEFNKLDFIPLFLKQVNKTSGLVAARINIYGTLPETAITGDMTLREGTADIPDLGLKLRDINLSLKGDERGRYTIEGRLSSGSAQAAIHGTAELHKKKAPSVALRIQGENFEAVKIPGTWLIVSPDINLRIKDKTIDFAGSLKIPRARLEPRDMSEAILPSKDVIVLDMPVSEKKEEWSVKGKLRLSLGNNVKFKGYGLTCYVTGGIDLTEQPGKVTQGYGELQIIDGKYKAYGQNLTIEKGRLIFAGLLDNPGLDIRAFRKIKDVTAGLIVQGTLKEPTLNVYSVPAMDESNALSYILFGRPMKQLSDSEGNELYGAALSTGLSAGGFVVQKIGAAFGVEDIEVEKGETPEQAMLFIGKYLSPELYLNYGIGLFEPVSTIRLRYNLKKKLHLQTEYGMESGGDILYIIEK
jgi:translocation and assembly module TamB